MNQLKTIKKQGYGRPDFICSSYLDLHNIKVSGKTYSQYFVCARNIGWNNKWTSKFLGSCLRQIPQLLILTFQHICLFYDNTKTHNQRKWKKLFHSCMSTYPYSCKLQSRNKLENMFVFKQPELNSFGIVDYET